MSQYEQGPRTPEPSGWAVGGVVFAATMMILIGVFQAINGIAAISKDEFFVVTDDYVYNLDTTAWGWIHLILGIIVALAGVFLIAGRAWAGIVALVLAALQAVSMFFFIPYYPFWAILVIALDVFVIWALTRPGVLRS
jgi:hypothetical protein